MRRTKSLVALSMVLAGCSDLGTSPTTSPVPAATMRNYGTSDADPATEFPVRIRSTSASVQMPTSSYDPAAKINAHMYYDAYHARIQSKAHVRDASGAVSQRDFLPVEKHTFASFLNNFHSAQWSLQVPAKTWGCGNTVEANVFFEAWWRGLSWGSGEFILDIVSDTKQTNGRQSECECQAGAGSENNELAHVVTYDGYDPYASSDLSGSSCAGSGGTGSGTYYKPGDYTGGETVSWGTGQGTGGESACGDKAIVQWVCVDLWIDGVWHEYSCGYATTC